MKGPPRTVSGRASSGTSDRLSRGGHGGLPSVLSVSPLFWLSVLMVLHIKTDSAKVLMNSLR